MITTQFASRLDLAEVNGSKNHHEKITYRNFKNFSKENFVNDLAGVPWITLDAYADVDKKLEC